MRAAVLEAVGETPHVKDFEEPGGQDIVTVTLAGCNPVDIVLASSDLLKPSVPLVVGQEGVGFTDDGTRVYFNSPPIPFGSWAERAAFDPDRAFPIPETVDDDLAVALGIAGLAAWLPLTRHAELSAGQSVLVLGATGVVGSIAVQAAKILGAGRVVAAGRNKDALEKTRDLGADALVELGGDDDAQALKEEAGDGYDVVLDMVYGEPFLAALESSAPQATLVTVGEGAGGAPEVPFRSLMGRTHVGHNNNVMGNAVMRQGYQELIALAEQKRLTVETVRYDLEDAGKAWQAQTESPHVKIGIVPK